MAKKRKITSIDDKCRICLSEDGCMSDIFSEDLKPKIIDLGDCTSIHINNDENLPRNICHVCLYKLDMWIEFKKQFLRSNVMLRQHLGIDEISDNFKKIKSDKALQKSEEQTNESQMVEKNSPICETIVIEDSPTKTIAESVVEKGEQIKIDEIPTTDCTRGVVLPIKQTSGKRGKTTERRKESTKRWVARKKALLAATGENETDTDSMSSDDEQLSPVQKARAKSNAEKVAESQRRIVKSLKNVDTNVADFYESKKNDKICEREESSSVEKKPADGLENRIDINQTENRIDVHAVNKENKPTEVNSEGPAKSAPTENVPDFFKPQSVRSELIIDDATFIVTSTLVLTEPDQLNTVSKENVYLSSDERNKERNTDIIDAVQLRRVCPKSGLQNEKKYVERCLNIEVEGTELATLQKVQSELANFVENKLSKTFDKYLSSAVDNRNKKISQTLNEKLKTIVKKSIKKNLDPSRFENFSIQNRSYNTFTADFVKAALRSKIFQPRVMLVRCDANSDAILKKIDRPDIRPIGKKSVGIFNQTSDSTPVMSLGKRRSVKPAKYADYDGSAYNTASDDSRDFLRKSEIESAPKSNKFKTYGPASAKHGNVLLSGERDGAKSAISSYGKSVESVFAINSGKKAHPASKSLGIDEKISGIAKNLTNNSGGEKHICGVCGDSFASRREVEIHFTAHKSTITANKQIKQKMMRCKRCHVIVEARYVKLHVCNSPKNNHKCYTCQATFRNDKLLVKHLETHSLEDKGKVETILGLKIESEMDRSTTTSVTKKKSSLTHIGGQSNDTYTCFVCDKIFEEEEVLKNHLQKHCDDISEEDDEEDDEEEEPNDDKELYQCAICGESLESEDALETHVEKHLFDDEDDNPNLISIGCNDRDRMKKKDETMIHGCSQCAETFDSEMLLMLHMQAHEEEVAIAEWERRGADHPQEEQHICVICDEVFYTEVELSEHLDVHNGNAHVCLLCDKPFLTLEELQSHVNTH